MLRLVLALCERRPVFEGHRRFLCTFKNQTQVSPLKTNLWKVATREHYGCSRKPDPEKITIWNKVFGKYLLMTNTISSGILMVFGDMIAQEVEMRRHFRDGLIASYDYERILRMFVVGAAMGPMHHYVYNWMDRIMPIANVRNSVMKILIDQLLMSPACILLFFYSACFMERKSLEETNKELKSKFLYIYLTDWLFWPGVQYINFQYLDIKYRVTFVNVCTAVYNIFLSYMKNDFQEFPGRSVQP